MVKSYRELYPVFIRYVVTVLITASNN